MKRIVTFFLALVLCFSLTFSADAISLFQKKPSGVKLSYANTCIMIGVGDKLNITATVTPSDAKNKSIQWTISNMNVISYSNVKKTNSGSSMTLTGKQVGKATITAKTINGIKSSFVVEVIKASTKKSQEFIQDSRWKHGIKWAGGQKPKITSKSFSGCAAYAADYSKYVFGKKSYKDKTVVFRKIDEIREHDVVEIKGHFFVVLSRNGNTLKTAEGNTSEKVFISSTKYYINNGKLMVKRGNKSEQLTFIKGYHLEPNQ